MSSLYQILRDLKTERDVPENAIRAKTAVSTRGLVWRSNRTRIFLECPRIFKRRFDRGLGEEHPETLNSINNLAGARLDQGLYADAEKLYHHTIEIRHRVLGEKHSDTPTAPFRSFFLGILPDTPGALTRCFIPPATIPVGHGSVGRLPVLFRSMSESTVSLESPETGVPSRWLAIAFLGLAIVILVVMRLHAFDVPLETDECNYAYIGARLLDGDRLYVDVWDHQPPGAFVLFAGAIAVFGDSPDVFRWMATLASVGTLLLVFATARCVCGTDPRLGDRQSRLGNRQCRLGNRAASVAAILFALVSSDPGTAGEGVNREVFMNVFVAAAWYVLLRRMPRSTAHPPSVPHLSSWTVFFSGLLLGVGSLLKTVLAIHWVALVVWLAVATWQGNDRGRRGAPILRQTLIFGAGPFLIWLVTLGYFSADGRGVDFVDAVFGFNLSYSGGEGILTRLGWFCAPPRHPLTLESAMPLWIVAGVALLWSMYSVARRMDLHLVAIISMIFASVIAVCMPGMFWPHYYHLLAPGCAIIVAAFVVACAQRVSDNISIGWQRAKLTALAICAATPVWLGFSEYRHYLRQPPFGITEKRYHTRDFWARAHGENVRRVTDPDDQIFVFGKDVGIYYYSGRKCASRYTMITGVQQAFSGADRRRRIMMEELELRKPRLILVLADEPAFPEWVAFLHKFYSQPVGWDFHDLTRKPIMFVVARKDSPVAPLNWDWDRSEIRGPNPDP